MEALSQVTPKGMTLFTFFCAGTEAVEGAMRVARAKTGKQGFASFFNDYHGRTGSAAGVTAARSWNGVRPPGSWLVPSGHCYRCALNQEYPSCELACARLLEHSILQNMPGETAGVVMELITNGNGATVYQDEYVPMVAEICKRNGVMFIADEVATGFGRTGAWFASDHYGVVPDVMAIGKGLGNGFPVTAIAVREEHAEALADSFPLDVVRRQPHGLRGNPRDDRPDAARAPRRALQGSRRVRPRTDARAPGAPPDRR